MRSVARSISRPVKERLHKGQLFQVLAVFDHACDLATQDGEVIALVRPHIGDGPLNIVVNGQQGPFSNLASGMPVTVKEELLWIDGWRVDFRMAAVWEPRPDWDTLRARCATIASRRALLSSISRHSAPADTFLSLLDPPGFDDRFAGVICSTAQKAAGALQEGWAGDLRQLEAGAVALAGLGRGLTPAGDDFLGGVMLWAWLAHPDPELFCRTLVRAAAPRTTVLSASFLRAAARGECGVAWHGLLAALNGGIEAEITAATGQVLSQGATSGADGLGGFLYLGT